MNDNHPVHGLPVRDAIFELVSEPWRAHARTLLLMEQERGASGTSRHRHVLWVDLCVRLQRRELEAHGSAAGHGAPVRIDPGFFRSAVPDYDAGTVSASGRSYHRVRIRPAGTADDGAEPEAAAGRHDWPSFNRELVRATGVVGFGSGQELLTHMTAWCTTTWPAAPDEQTIRARISGFYGAVASEP